MQKFYLALFLFFGATTLRSSANDEKVTRIKECYSTFAKYDFKLCEVYWNCTVSELLSNWKFGINRKLIYNMEASIFAHTPMWLRVASGKLHCIPIKKNSKYRMKIYRALHYINRLNRILRDFPKSIPEATEWLSHHSDWVKVPQNAMYPPVFAVSGDKSHNDIPGVPFMSFSDSISKHENIAFEKRYDSISTFHQQWRRRTSSAFFRGSLSDCSASLSLHRGDLNYCPRAKVVLEAARVKSNLLSGIKLVKGKFPFSDLDRCSLCQGDKLSGDEFVGELHKYKYLINFAGAGNWSRRLSLLLRSGGMIVQAESTGYQFYDFRLEPGVHFIPFDPEIGRIGAGNLISRLEWARKNDHLAEEIAQRSASFGRSCLSEGSIDYFVTKLLGEYGALLRGDIEEKSMIDLSPCFCGNEVDRCKTAKLCKGVIDRCWY